MGSMFRSEEMALCQLFIQPEAAYTSISELGESGTVQFRDLNPDVNSFQRKFVNEVRRCDEIERKLRYIEAEVRKYGVQIPDLDELPRAPNPRDMINLEARFEKTENEILEFTQSAVNLKSNFLELTELKQVLEKTQSFFAGHGGGVPVTLDGLRNLMPEEAQQVQGRGRLGFVAGVIQRERVAGFERMLWRISRGNVLLRRADINTVLEDPATGNRLYKTAFVAFFQGEQLKTRIKKVCAGYHASLYPCPSVPDERQEMLKGINTRLEDLKLVLHQTEDHRQRIFMSVAKDLPAWIAMVHKMKAIYHTLNMFNMDVTKKCLIGECWVPVNDLPIVRKALIDGSNSVGSAIQSFMNMIPTNENPPTFNRTNRFTRGFQNLIDAYGIASYREVNPALYSIITFPFLFGVMFGDVGHGIILTIVGAWMVIWEESLLAKKSHNEIWNIIFGGRYIILLMGVFSMYTGMIYNDVFSKSVNLFGSSWTIHNTTAEIMSSDDMDLDPKVDTGHNPYPIGMDPIWSLARNKIIFLNSFKMKVSIILGVVHMLFGVCMGVVNMIHFRNAISIVLEFVPQVLFLMLLFGYMVFMMFTKWILYSATAEDFEFTPGCAPSILNLFINMMLFKDGQVKPYCQEFMFSGQDTVQTVFVIIALICIPWMLLGKPLYIMLSKRSHHNDGTNGGVGHDISETQTVFPIEQDHVEEEHVLSEVFIHQAIHTIEYALSTISNTASYLRLWALSLAHNQLSEVIWTMVLTNGFSKTGIVGGIYMYIAFAAWAAGTVAILVVMEGLSAFLHTLRLHWVEFMSKFYEGVGYPFQPFNFSTILKSEENTESSK